MNQGRHRRRACIGESARYVTDFPTKEIVGVRGAIVIPHLGASTEESEDNCAKMAAAEVKDFLENGNITHSVNFPDCDMGAKGEGERITILHKKYSEYDRTVHRSFG